VAGGFTAYDFRDSFTPKALCERGVTDVPLLSSYQGWVSWRGECIQLGPQESYVGLLVLGGETTEFIPDARFEERLCKSGTGWWIETGTRDAVRALSRIYDEPSTLGGSLKSLKVTLRGRRTTEAGNFGHLGAADHLLVVNEIGSAVQEPPDTPQPWPC
jgi:hypothetical protein